MMSYWEKLAISVEEAAVVSRGRRESVGKEAVRCAYLEGVRTAKVR